MVGPMRVAIIGSGFSGLCLGIQLKRAGIDSFTIFEKADRLGGTWRENTYPGAACDVPSFAYCFSFAQKTDWTRKWSPQAEILEYMDDCARKFGVLEHIRFDTEIAGARFDEAAQVWRLRTVAGEEVEADVLVSSVGQLMIECQTQYIMGCLRQMAARGLQSIEIRPDALDAYYGRITRSLEGTAWAATGKSWYKTADGTITNNWPGTTVRYWWETRRSDLNVYRVTARMGARAEDRNAAAA
jgi:hypothetical protein